MNSRDPPINFSLGMESSERFTTERAETMIVSSHSLNLFLISLSYSFLLQITITSSLFLSLVWKCNFQNCPPSTCLLFPYPIVSIMIDWKGLKDVYGQISQVDIDVRCWKKMEFFFFFTKLLDRISPQVL